MPNNVNEASIPPGRHYTRKALALWNMCALGRLTGYADLKIEQGIGLPSSYPRILNAYNDTFFEAGSLQGHCCAHCYAAALGLIDVQAAAELGQTVAHRPQGVQARALVGAVEQADP